MSLRKPSRKISPDLMKRVTSVPRVLLYPRDSTPSLRVILMFGVMFLTCASSPGQSSRPSQNVKVAGQPPAVMISEQGQHALRLTEGQQAAVSLFLSAHPDMQLADCQTLGYAPDACAKAYDDWKAVVVDAKADLQYPYAAWGDFNHDGRLDLGRVNTNDI